MDPAREQQVLSKALERGWVTPQQVESCRQLQALPGSPQSVLTLLLQEGYLSREQVVELVTGKRAPAPVKAEPKPEGVAGVEEIPLSAEDLGAAIEPSEEQAPIGEPIELEAVPSEEPAAAPTAAAPKLPTLAECELVADLGGGPLTTTCVVRDPGGRQYVLKVLHASVAQRPGFVEQVHRQAAAAAKIDHPNVARVLGSGELAGDTYVLSEYVEGASVQQLLDAKGRLEPGEALAVGVACATALEQAAGAGLVHGAVTPTNILVAQDGTTKLADLGLPKPPTEELSITGRGAGVRAPFYLSPEHVSRGRLDVRSDLFTLGATLYHAVTGQRPVAGDTTAEVTAAICRGDVRPVHEVAPAVPRALGTIVEKLLRPDPAQRYQTPHDLLADLAAFHAGKVPAAQRAVVAGIQARKAEEKVAAEKAAVAAAEAAPARSRRGLWVAAAIVLAALIGLGIWLATRPRKPPESQEDAEVREVADPVKRTRKGREELQRTVEGHKPAKGKELQAVQDTIKSLRAIEQKYKGTEVAEEARKKLVPFQAEAMFQNALAFAREHPGDRAAVLQRFREVTAKFATTEAAYKAERELDKLEGTEQKQVQRALDEARQRAAKLVEQQRFGAALREFEEFLKTPRSEEIKQLVHLEEMDVKTKATRAYDKLHEQAQERIRSQSYAEAKMLYGQVVDTFGLEPYVGRAKGEIAILEPLVASASKRRVKVIEAAKYEFFLVRVEPSSALARTWDLKQAKQEAEKLRPELRTVGLEQYLDDYLADLDLLADLKQRVIRRLNDEAKPILAKEFSLGKVGNRFEPAWLEARVLRADDAEMVLRYGEVEVHRAWGQCPPDDLYRLGRLVADATDPKNRLTLGILCLYAGLTKTAQTELNAAKAAGVEDAAAYLKRLELSRPATAAGRTKEEEASQLFLEAKRYLNERAWDRALYRLALLRARHATKDYDVSANLAEIDQRIAECRKHVDKMEMEADLALGKPVALFRLDDLSEWQKPFGTWTLKDGVLTGEVAEKHDGECLLSLAHAPSYELRVQVRVLSGTGAILRLAGKARPNLGFWVHATKPALVGLLYAQPTDEQPAERVCRPFPFKPGEWQEVRAVVSPAYVEVTLGTDYTVRMPNNLPGRNDAVQTYGLMVNAASKAEFRDLSVRVLQEQ